MIASAILYMTISIETALLASQLQKNRGIKRKIFYFFTIIFPAIFAGLRYGIGTDYWVTYSPYFDYLSGRGAFSLFDRQALDPIYYLINILVIALHGNVQWVLFIVSVITFIFLQKALLEHKEYISVGLATFIFMLLYYQMSYNLVRQVTAMTIVLYATKYIISREPKRFIIWVLVAVGFHKTALIVLPFYIILNVITKKKYKILSYVFYFGVLYFVLNFQQFQPIIAYIDSSGYYSRYLNRISGFGVSVGFIIRLIPYMLLMFLCWSNYKTHIEKRTISIYLNMFWFGTAVRVMAYMTAYDAERIGYYFLMPQVVMIPYLVKGKKKSQKRDIALVIMLISIIYIWFWDFILHNNNATVPYQWVFSPNIAYR